MFEYLTRYRRTGTLNKGTRDHDLLIFPKHGIGNLLNIASVLANDAFTPSVIMPWWVSAASHTALGASLRPGAPRSCCIRVRRGKSFFHYFLYVFRVLDVQI
jgi:hypothetical protein